MGDEDIALNPGHGRAVGAAAGGVSGRCAGDGLVSLLQRTRDTDRAGPVFERSGRVSPVVFEPQATDPDGGGETRRFDDRRPAEMARLWAEFVFERQQLAIAPV